MWAPARFGLYVLFDLCGERGTARGVGRPDPRTSCLSVCGECECESQVGFYRVTTSLQLVPPRARSAVATVVRATSE